MLSTLLMLVWILAICWLRSDGQAQSVNPENLAAEAVAPIQDTNHNEKIKLQEQVKVKRLSIEIPQSSPLSNLTQVDIKEEISPSVTSAEIMEPPIYEKDWKSSCCLITNKKGKKLAGVTLKQRIGKLTQLEVLI